MDAELIPALQWLTAEQAFRLVYGAYEHLASPACEAAASGTRRRLLRLRTGDADDALGCVARMMEESDEVRGVMMGTHAHPGRPLRETLVGELNQVLYWPLVLAVGRGVTWEQANLPAALAGAAGNAGDRAEVRILRKAFAFVLTCCEVFTRLNPAGPLGPVEVALADLLQMAEKDYLAGLLRQRLLK